MTTLLYHQTNKDLKLPKVFHIISIEAPALVTQYTFMNLEIV